MNLTLSRDTHDATLVLVARGELDLHTAPKLAEALDDVVTAGSGPLVVDLTRVTFMDSAGLGRLVRGYHDMASAERGMAVVCAPGATRRLFGMTGVDKLVPVLQTREAAVAALSGE